MTSEIEVVLWDTSPLVPVLMPGGVKFVLNCRNNTNIQKQKIGRERKYVYILRVMIMSKLVQFSILLTKI